MLRALMAQLPDKETSFFEWYNEVLEVANVTDKRYPVKGVNVWTPFGFKAVSLMDRLIREKVTPLGYQEVCFPTLIPESELNKEAEHIKGFGEEVYWVTHGGRTELDIKLALRPTSETAMYPIFALWVRSHRDLPLQVFQIVNTFRYETKSTRPLIRVREIHFFEGHTVQLGDAEAESQARADLASFREIAKVLCLPYVMDRRPDWDKFPGAFYSIACDLPVGGNRTLQIGTVHHYSQNFAKPYGISYEDKDGARLVPSQTTYGISERLLGGTIAIHGDQKGLVWPSFVAPTQVVIIPIPGENDPAPLIARAEEVRAELLRIPLRVEIDATEGRPGAKYYAWEMKGVPLRIEIGRRELEEGTLSAVNRLGGRTKLAKGDAAAQVQAALAAYDVALTERARKSFATNVNVARDGPGVVAEKANLVGWCGEQTCAQEVEKRWGLSVLGRLEEAPEALSLGPAPPPCIVCSKSGGAWSLAAKAL